MSTVCVRGYKIECYAVSGTQKMAYIRLYEGMEDSQLESLDKERQRDYIDRLNRGWSGGNYSI